MPNMVMRSEEAKKIILIELTVLREYGFEEAFLRKNTEYQEVVQQCRDKEWQAWLFQLRLAAGAFWHSLCGTRSQHWEQPEERGRQLIVS